MVGICGLASWLGWTLTIGMTCQNPSYLSERCPTEVRETPSDFCYHLGAIFGGLVRPIRGYLAATWQTGFAIPMLVGTVLGAVSLILARVLASETEGKEIVSDPLSPDPGRRYIRLDCLVEG
jgi:hypothetical protein